MMDNLSNVFLLILIFIFIMIYCFNYNINLIPLIYAETIGKNTTNFNFKILKIDMGNLTTDIGISIMPNQKVQQYFIVKDIPLVGNPSMFPSDNYFVNITLPVYNNSKNINPSNTLEYKNNLN